MGQKFSTPNPKIALRALVRDVNGKPKFDKTDKIKDFEHLLSDDDITYLENKHSIKIKD